MQCIKNLVFQFRVETGVGKQCVVDPDMANIKREGAADASALKRRKHQAYDFAVGLDGATTEQFRAQLNRRPAADHRLRGALQC